MSKLRSAFGIDDILYQNGASSSSSSTSKSPSRLISDKACDYAASVSSSMPIPSDIYMNTAHQPKKPYAQFPPAMNFAKSNFYMPDLASAFSSTAYLEQYANALKGMYRIILPMMIIKYASWSRPWFLNTGYISWASYRSTLLLWLRSPLAFSQHRYGVMTMYFVCSAPPLNYVYHCIWRIEIGFGRWLIDSDDPIVPKLYLPIKCY